MLTPKLPVLALQVTMERSLRGMVTMRGGVPAGRAVPVRAEEAEEEGVCAELALTRLRVTTLESRGLLGIMSCTEAGLGEMLRREAPLA
jgi:hypothetical protein